MHDSRLPTDIDDRFLGLLVPRPSLRSRGKGIEGNPLQDVMCINCQEMVSIEGIGEHSITCTVVSPEVLENEALDDDAARAVFRAKKLSAHLHKAKTSPMQSPSDRNLLGIAYNLSVRLHSNRSVLVCGQVLTSLESILPVFKGAISVLFLLERLKALAQELQDALMASELQEKDSEIATLRLQLQSEIIKVQDARANTNCRIRIEQVNSEVQSVKSFSSDSEVESLTEGTEGLREGEKGGNPQDLKRAFYSQCLAVRLGLKTKTRGLKVSIPGLYNKALSEGISMDDWPAFIRQNMTHPEPSLFHGEASQPRFLPRKIDPNFTYLDAFPNDVESSVALD